MRKKLESQPILVAVVIGIFGEHLKPRIPLADIDMLN